MDEKKRLEILEQHLLTLQAQVDALSRQLKTSTEEIKSLIKREGRAARHA